jgi:dTDP-4-amino-4,6-dideoxygalactose transaminase
MVDRAEPFLVFGKPVLGDEEMAEVQACLASGWLGTGPRVAEFERAFAEYKGARFAAALSSCTAALHLSIIAAGIGPGDEVITTAMTFCATVNAVTNAGGVPVLADVDARTQNIDPAAVEAAITERTKAILIVHFAGRPCDMERIMKVAAKHSLVVIEDCAHAVETTFQGRRAGTFGEFGCFSFYATKNLTTGEGGMVLARSEKDAQRIKRLALHGMTADAWRRFGDDGYRHYYVNDRGFKCNMMDLQAAIGIHQLARVENNWIKRLAVWNKYEELLAETPVTRPAAFEPETRHGLHLYTIQVDDRDRVLDLMTKDGIGLGVHYLAIPEHPFFSETYGWQPEAFPHATAFGRRTLSLPLSPHLTDGEVERVVASLQRALTTVDRAGSAVG